MSKYKQHIIPSVTTPKEWQHMSQSELRKVVYQFIKCNLAGKVIKNEDTGINVQITVSAGRKTAYGEAMYLKKSLCCSNYSASNSLC